ncbi:hypothetical protein GYMLUDRAFT_67310 [Collybiopsis luxurians FD-317 M1]|nr:hypothetical protein GYMLUDRAFT_67310 [Collybiopsis luxurians FD-317 M1]
MSTQQNRNLFLSFPTLTWVASETTANQSPLQVSEEPRRCSARGCSKLLSPNSIQKMCDRCRERHRAYGATKRAKRKLEKAALLGQADAASPELEPVPTPSSSASAVDSGVDNIVDDDIIQGESPAVGVRRMCSSKGCKTSGSLDDQFTMCIPCRNRYNRIIQEGKRWREDLKSPSNIPEELNAESTNFSPSTPSAAGMSPVPIDETATLPLSFKKHTISMPPDTNITGSSVTLDQCQVARSSSSPSLDHPVILPDPLQHICTVSHCHIVLPGTYIYKRCEKHRAQDRAHGRLRLKRVRLGLITGKSSSSASHISAIGRKHHSKHPDIANGQDDNLEDRSDDNPTQDDDSRQEKLKHSESLAHGHDHDSTKDLPNAEGKAREHTGRVTAADKSLPKTRVRKQKRVGTKTKTTKHASTPSAMSRASDKGNEKKKRSSGDNGRGAEDVEVAAALDECSRSDNQVHVEKGGADVGRLLRSSFVCSGNGCMNLVIPRESWQMCVTCCVARATTKPEVQMQMYEEACRRSSAGTSRVTNPAHSANAEAVHGAKGVGVPVVDSSAEDAYASTECNANSDLSSSASSSTSLTSGSILFLERAVFNNTQAHNSQHAPYNYAVLDPSPITMSNMSTTCPPVVTASAYSGSNMHPYPQRYPISSPSPFITSSPFVADRAPASASSSTENGRRGNNEGVEELKPPSSSHSSSSISSLSAGLASQLAVRDIPSSSAVPSAAIAMLTSSPATAAFPTPTVNELPSVSSADRTAKVGSRFSSASSNKYLTGSRSSLPSPQLLRSTVSPTYTSKFALTSPILPPPLPRGRPAINSWLPTPSANTEHGVGGSIHTFPVSKVESGGAPASAFGKFRFDTATTAVTSTLVFPNAVQAQLRNDATTSTGTETNSKKRKRTESEGDQSSGQAKEAQDTTTNQHGTLPIPGYPYYSCMLPPHYTSYPTTSIPGPSSSSSAQSSAAATVPLLTHYPPQHPYAYTPGYITPSLAASYTTDAYLHGGPHAAYSYSPHSAYPGYGISAYPGYPVQMYGNQSLSFLSASGVRTSRYEEVLNARVKGKGKGKARKGNTTMGVESVSNKSGSPLDATVSSQPHPSASASERLCVTKNCRRSLPPNTSRNVCERCQVRFKKHLSRTKQRYRLEPKKMIVHATRRQKLNQDVADDNEDEDADAGAVELIIK